MQVSDNVNFLCVCVSSIDFSVKTEGKSTGKKN